MKKIFTLLMTAVCLLLLSSCHSLPPTISEVQRRDDEAAESILQENRQPFIDKVNEVYGDSASLYDIECVRIRPEDYDPGYASYYEELKATLTIDGTNYVALYNCKTGTLRDTVHTEAICSELTDSFPLDQSKIIDIVIPRDSTFWDHGEQLTFPYEVKNLEDALTYDETSCAPIHIWIYTAEDMSSFTEENFSSIPEINRLKDSTSLDKITIISLTDNSALTKLKEKMAKDMLCIDHLGDPSFTEEFFSEYHITNAVIVKNDFDTFDEKPHCLVVRKIKESHHVRRLRNGRLAN